MNRVNFFNLKSKNLYIFLFMLFFFTSCKNDYVFFINKENLYVNKIYKNSVKYAKEGNYKKSIKNFLLLETLYPYNKFSRKSKLVTIFCYYKNKNYDLALFNIENFSLQYPIYKVDFILYIKSLVYYDQYILWYLKYFPISFLDNDISSAKKSFFCLKSLIEKFNASKYTLNSIHRIIFLRKKMIKYELSIAKYYIKRKAYLSAANRASLIMKNYEKDIHLLDALKIIIYSYNKSYFYFLHKEAKIMLKNNCGKLFYKLETF